MKKPAIALFILLTTITFAQNDTSKVEYVTWDNSEPKFGAEIDILPYFNKGYDFSLWFGYYLFKAQINWSLKYPAEFVVDKGFSDLRYKSTSLHLQYFPVADNPILDKLWFGAGIDFWSNKVKNSLTNVVGTFNNFLLSTSVGFLVFVYDKFYLNPYLSGHLLLFGDKSVYIGGTIYDIQKFVPEISVRAGYHF